MYRFSLSLLNKMDSLTNYSRMFGEDDVKAEVGPDKLSSSDDAGNPNAAWRKRAKRCQCQTVKPMDPNTPVKEDCVRFVCISDTHTKLEQFKNLEIPDGDVLIHAGDFTMQGMPDEVDVVNKYLGTLPHKHKVIIAGNHDITFDLDHVKKNGSRKIWSLTTGMELESCFEHFGVNTVHEMLTDCIYLEDSSVEIYGIKIYGSPWTAGRGSWGFQRQRGSALMKKWNQIPADTDILVTHSPPCGIGDNVNVGVAYKLKRMVGGPAANHVGCVDLLDTVQKRVKPKYHIFGHIHEGYGVTTDGTTTFINASTCTHTYDPSNPAIVFDVPLPAGYSKDQDKKEDGSGKLSDEKKRPRSKDRKRSRSRDRKRSHRSKHDHSSKSKRRRSRSRSKDRKRRRSRDHHRHKDKKSRDRKSSRDEKRSKSRERKDSKSENRKSEGREHKDSTSEKNVTETKSSTDVKCDIKDNKDSKSEGHRKRSRSRDRKDKKKDRRRSRSRHRHRSRSRDKRSRDRKRSRSKERKRSRSKDRKRKHRSRSRDRRSRSRHRSRERHSRSRSWERLRSRSPVMGRKLTFKEQMRKEFINASKEMSNQEHKGSGVFAVGNIDKGALLTYYEGELISKEEGDRRHENYEESDGSFLFFFKFKKENFCIDATRSSGIGRMINDEHKKPNSKVVVEDNNGQPSLCIYSIRRILRGEEICFDYNDPSVPWRKRNVSRNFLYPRPDKSYGTGCTESAVNDTLCIQEQADNEYDYVGENVVSNADCVQEQFGNIPGNKEEQPENDHGNVQEQAIKFFCSVQEEEDIDLGGIQNLADSHHRNVKEKTVSDPGSVQEQSHSDPGSIQEQSNSDHGNVQEQADKAPGHAQEIYDIKPISIQEQADNEPCSVKQSNVNKHDRIQKQFDSNCVYIKDCIQVHADYDSGSIDEKYDIIPGSLQKRSEINPYSAQKQVDSDSYSVEEGVAIDTDRIEEGSDNDLYRKQEQVEQEQTSSDPGNEIEEAENDHGSTADFFGAVIVMNEKEESDVFAMCSTVMALGSARTNDIIVKNAAPHEIILQANRFGEVFLFQNKTKFSKAHCLQHDEVFSAGRRLFKWKYPVELDDRHSVRFTERTEIDHDCDNEYDEDDQVLAEQQADIDTSNFKEQADIYPHHVKIQTDTITDSGEHLVDNIDYGEHKVDNADGVDQLVDNFCVEQLVGNTDCEEQGANELDCEKDWIDSETEQETLDTEINDDDSVKDPDYWCTESDAKYISEDDYVSDSDDNSDIIPFLKPLPMLQNKRKLESDCLGIKKMKKSNQCEVVSPTESSGRQTQHANALSNQYDNVKLQPSRNEKGKRVWDKLHVCVYCEESFTNLTKHLLRRHKNENEVVRIRNLPKKSKIRADSLLKLRNAGDYKHNMDVLKNGNGTLITWSRKEGDEHCPSDYLPCEDCLAFFLKDTLWRHKKTCPFKKDTQVNRQVQSSASLLLPVSKKISAGMKEKVMKNMLYDEVTMAVRNDSLILAIGEKLFQKHGHLKHLSTYISQKMRELGRLLITARKIDPKIQFLSDLISPAKFSEVVVPATRALCKYDDSTNGYGNPSLAIKIGHLLKKCARIKKSASLISGDSIYGKQADDFLNLIENEWTDEVSSCALQTLKSNKMNKAQILPLTEDIMKLQGYLQNLRNSSVETLQKKFSKSAYDTLNQVTLARLVLFNRRRGGETQRVTVEAYVSRRNKTSNLQEVEEYLTPVEKMLCATFSRIEIRGKKGRTVPVLLTSEIESNIDLLLQHREMAGIHPENLYLFPRSNFNSKEPIRSTDVLRKYAKEANLCKAENITSTKLRKHIATVSQVLNLSRHDLETMAEFMGHDIDIHRSFYRLPQETIQVVKMGRLLSAFDNGTIAQYRGKTLDEITVESDTELTSDSDSDTGNDDDCEASILKPNETEILKPNETEILKPNEEAVRVVSDLDALRKPGEALRPSDLLKGVKLNSGESVTPQMALIQTMAAMHKKAQELTGVEVPKYYNPAAVNPLKYAEQVQKRKLLWSKKTDDNQKEKNDHMETQWKSAFVSTEDNKTASKFRKLMGMKGGEGQSSAEELPEDLQKLSEEQQRKQAELFQRLDQDYQFARMTTHTQRGVGLGFSTTIIDPNHPQNPP